MATIVNNPAPVQQAPSGDSSGPLGMIIGLIVLVGVLYMFFIYGLPAIRSMGTPQINIPNQIDVNVKQEK